jgi:hypothetical protein
MTEVGFFAFSPGRLGQGLSVGAGFYQFEDMGSEEFTEAVAEELGASHVIGTIFNGIVKERGDGLIFVPAVFEHLGGDGEQV